MHKNGCDLESRLIEVAMTKLLEGVTDLPLVNALSGFDEVVEILTNVELRTSMFEELEVKRFLQILLRSFHHALAAPIPLHHRHFSDSSSSCAYSLIPQIGNGNVRAPRNQTQNPNCSPLHSLKWTLNHNVKLF